MRSGVCFTVVQLKQKGDKQAKQIIINLGEQCMEFHFTIFSLDVFENFHNKNLKNEP